MRWVSESVEKHDSLGKEEGRLTNSLNREKQIKLYLIGGVAVAVLFAGLASLKTWPVLDGDAPAYFSPAVEFSQGRALTNPTWLPPLDESIDGPGGRRYIYHGFVYPLLIGWLGKFVGGGAAACVAWMHFFNVIAALSCAVGVLGFCRQQDGLRKNLSFILPLFFFALCEAYAGRPEPAVLLLMGLGLIAIQKLRGIFLTSTLNALCGLIFLTSPAIGVLSVLPLLAFRFSQKEKTPLTESAVGVAAFIAALALGFSFYPYPPADWFHGVWRHGRINLALPQGQGFLQTWITWAQAPLLIFTFGITALIALNCVLKRNNGRENVTRICSLTVLLLFLVGLGKVAFSKTEASYNAVVWIPLFLAILLTEEPDKASRVALLFALFLPVFGLARSSFVLVHQFRAAAVSLSQVSSVILEKEREGIQISTGLFLAAPNLNVVSFGAGSKPLWRIEQQTNRGVSQPPEIHAYSLEENKFDNPIRILGLPISRTPGGWEYALYRRMD